MPTKSDLCKTCGECCQFFILQIHKPEPIGHSYEWRGWLKARGVSILQENQKYWRLKIPMPCPHLQKNVESWGEGFKNVSYSCDIWGKHPIVCQKFDGRLEDPRDGLNCLWKTEKIEEEKKEHGKPL
jgi:Fe-S-cluster containining protein